MASNILVLNAGSSSLKFRLFDQMQRAVLGGVVERIGDRDSSLVTTSKQKQQVVIFC